MEENIDNSWNYDCTSGNAPNYIFPISPSIYARIRSWILNEAEVSPELIRGNPINRKIENVKMLDRYNVRNPSQGTLYITTTHLIFVGPDSKKETWILHWHIAGIEKLALTTTGSPLQIRCKNFLSVTFVVPRERDCYDIYLTLQRLSQPSNIEDLYCFFYTSSDEDIPQPAGWNFFDLQSEFLRMRVPNDQWCLTLTNKDYDLCDTYPRYIYVPTSANTTVLIGSSRFRSKGRLPVLTYLHHNKASICRSSQPLSGFSARCLEDEQMLNCILRTNPNSKFMYVVDTRPKINAMANRAAGKGYENEAFYDNIKFQFLGIENIHVMRNSLQKLLETCELKNATMSSFIGGLESSGWLRHIKAILDTSWFIAQAIDEGISVVVHCSDGWDRTAQVCSIAALLLDPYYRTIQGFQALIEKDWLAFGHKFTERCGFIQGDSKEVSPIFTQFIDVTWQLTQQRPSAFQFNERFLLTLHDHVQSCQYGTFIGNCEKDRVDLRLAERTFSLWGYMANHMNEYMNPLYNSDDVPGVYKPCLAPQTIRFWRGMYSRFETGIHPREPINDLLLATCDHSSSLEDHIRYLTKKVTSLKSLISKASGMRKVKSPTNSNISSPDPTNAIDNKTLYEKSTLESADDSHPLKVSSDKKEEDAVNSNNVNSPAMDQITEELESVALDWKTLRNVKECVCTTPFDNFSRKHHCYRCGDVFCTRCIDKHHTSLPGHYSQRAVPVCRPCYQIITRSESVETPE